MSPNSEYAEHRACHRFPVRKRSSVVLLPDNIISERILDVSEKGIAFCYRGQGLTDRIHDKAVINLVAMKMRLSNVSVRIVSDWKIETVDDEGLRRCGLEFVSLSQNQLKMIKAMIETLFR